MSYSACTCVAVASRDAVPAILADDDGLAAAERALQIRARSRDAALSSALCALAAVRAPQALALFVRPWKLAAHGPLTLTGGRHADALVGEDLEAALAATDALIAAWSAEPLAMSYVLASDFPMHADAGERAAAIRATAAAAMGGSPQQAFETFERVHDDRDLQLSALFAWLQVFAAQLRRARSLDAAVVHVAWF